MGSSEASTIITSFPKRRALTLWREGQKFHFRGNLQQAIQFYDKSLYVFPTAEAYTFRGWAYSIQGRLQEAIDECKKATELDPSFGNPYNDIGSYLVALGRPEEAIAWFEKAIQAPRYEPRHFPHINLGRIFASKGLLLRAIREFEAALALRPRDRACQAALKALYEALVYPQVAKQS